MNRILTLLVFVGFFASCQAEPNVIYSEPIQVSVVDNLPMPTISILETNDKIVGSYEIKGVIYDVYEGSRGGWYIKRLSAKTGNEYKQYLNADQKLKVIKN